MSSRYRYRLAGPAPAAGAEVEDLTGDACQIIDLADPVGDLAEAWLAGRLLPPIASPLSALRCQIAGCISIPFVQIKTAAGRHNLCLCHFQSVKVRAKHTQAMRKAASRAEVAMEAVDGPASEPQQTQKLRRNYG